MLADRSVAAWQAGRLGMGARSMWGRKQRLGPNRRVRRRRWQETIIAKANLLEHEGQLLYREGQLRDQQEQLATSAGSQEAIRDVVLTAVKKQLKDAHMAASDEGEAGKVGESGKDSLQKCLPETDQRLLKAKAALDPAVDSTGDRLATIARTDAATAGT